MICFTTYCYLTILLNLDPLKLINNQEIRLFDEIEKYLKTGSEVFISVSYFSLNAIFELSSKLNQSSKINILVDINSGQDLRFAYDQSEWSRYLDLKGKFKAESAFSLVKDKCDIRYANMGGQKFFLVKNGSSTHCFTIAPHDLNLASFGLIPSANPVITMSFEDAGDQYFKLFQQFWSNSTKDVKESILAIIEKACSEHKPEDIYKFNLYHIFHNATINEASEQRIKKIGFKDTLIWGMLYNFQQDAVLGAIDKIETYGGCIIADSVGLGKTFEALAVMKYYQMRKTGCWYFAQKSLEIIG